MRKEDIKMSDELFAAYLDGNVKEDEMKVVLAAIADDSLYSKMLQVVEYADESMSEQAGNTISIFPAQKLAAEGEDCMCDIRCEKFILASRAIELNECELSRFASDNCWLKEKGMPLHHIGRIMESKGIDVKRKYEVSVSELSILLKGNNDIIAVVNNDKLLNPECEDKNPNHAVVVLDVNEKINLVRIFNPSSLHGKESYTVAEFVSAWSDSNNYLVSAQPQGTAYSPSPFDLSDIVLDYDFIELRESIAENAHENWAEMRQREGWAYGAVRDEAQKKTPDMVPYSKLPEKEKDYDRNMAMQTIKLVKKLGFETIKVQEKQEYNMLIHRLKMLEYGTYYCSNCHSPIFKGQQYCEQCGKKLDINDFEE